MSLTVSIVDGEGGHLERVTVVGQRSQLMNERPVTDGKRSCAIEKENHVERAAL